MLQPHGGSQEGFHFPLRKGTEVMLSFMGGHPDRPVIVGVGSNTCTPSPVTQQNATQNVIQTGGLNRLTMEDVKGGSTSIWNARWRGHHCTWGPTRGRASTTSSWPPMVMG